MSASGGQVRTKPCRRYLHCKAVTEAVKLKLDVVVVVPHDFSVFPALDHRVLPSQQTHIYDSNQCHKYLKSE